MKKLICGAMLLLLLTGCDQRKAQSVGETTNKDYTAELLFEHDGVKVYRFADAGEWIYYTKPVSTTTRMREVTDSEGTSSIDPIRVFNRQ
jgi:tRNA(His) 5'-end guanylyltransferase